MNIHNNGKNKVNDGGGVAEDQLKQLRDDIVKKFNNFDQIKNNTSKNLETKISELKEIVNELTRENILARYTLIDDDIQLNGEIKAISDKNTKFTDIIKALEIIKEINTAPNDLINMTHVDSLKNLEKLDNNDIINILQNITSEQRKKEYMKQFPTMIRKIIDNTIGKAFGTARNVITKTNPISSLPKNENIKKSLETTTTKLGNIITKLNTEPKTELLTQLESLRAQLQNMNT